MMRNEEKKAERFIREHGMIKAGDVVAAGVSGGADSVCLLFMLCSLREKLGFELKVCHVNHGLRGEEADADQRYVEELCRSLDIPCRVFRKDVELISRKRKQSPEEAGRTARQEAFETMCREEGCTKIATAHHQEDNAETVLLNIARGTGLKGLCGIRPVRGIWIRPLLPLTREDIEAFLIQRGISWCEDRTNQEDMYTRNRIRHHVLPALKEQVNAGAAEHLNELSRQAQEAWEYLEWGTDRAWERCVTEKNGFHISRQQFLEEMPAVQKQILKRCISKISGSERDIGAAHISALRRLFGCQSGKMVCLPGGICAQRRYEEIVLRREEKRDTAEREEVILQIPGTVQIPGSGLSVCCRFIEDADPLKAVQFPQKSYTKWMDYDIMKRRPSVRTRRSGDYLVMDDKGRRQKLKNYFINEKIPREEREKMLLIADGNHVLWIPGQRMSAACRIGKETKRILEIKIMEERKDGRDN